MDQDYLYPIPDNHYNIVFPNWSAESPVNALELDEFENYSTYSSSIYQPSLYLDCDDSSTLEGNSYDMEGQSLDSSTIFSATTPYDTSDDVLTQQEPDRCQVPKVSTKAPIVVQEDPHDNDEYVPDCKEHDDFTNSICTITTKPSKKSSTRVRGHNLGRDIRFRIGQLMVGFKNRYPRKTKKEIANLIAKRLNIEFPYSFHFLIHA